MKWKFIFFLIALAPCVTCQAQATTLAAGGDQTCAITNGGEVMCWGSRPHIVSGVHQAISLSLGQFAACALLADGTVTCWGRNDAGQLGDGTTNDNYTPQPVAGLSNATAISMGRYHACAVMKDGTVECWGGNQEGQLGNDSTTTQLHPVPVFGLETATAVAAGKYHTCAITTDGRVLCWGNNSHSQLGDETEVKRAIPQEVAGVNDAIAIAAGRYLSCALEKSGNVKCWGTRQKSPADLPTPTTVLSHAVSLAAGGNNVCALDENGKASCWGYNQSGQLGDGSTAVRDDAVAVMDVTHATAVAVGYTHSCAETRDGKIWCWGNNDAGQIGNGVTLAKAETAQQVQGINNASMVAVGKGFTCALTHDGRVKCWGDNSAGQLGDGTLIHRLKPTTVLGVHDVKHLVAGDSFACALTNAGQVTCWGMNKYGQVGNGESSPYSAPTTIPGISALSLSAYGDNTCVATLQGLVQCWGGNIYGEVGMYYAHPGSGIKSHPDPYTLPGITGAILVATGEDHSCALSTNGAVTCWGGKYYGEINAKKVNPPLPVKVMDAKGAIAITSKCALWPDGSTKCWQSYTRDPLKTVTDAITTLIQSWNSNNCIVTQKGEVKCWGGGNFFGQLGNGHTTQDEGLVTATNVSDAIGVSGIYDHVCAVLKDGGVKCWGSDTHGQLGDGKAAYYPIPQQVLGTPFANTATSTTDTPDQADMPPANGGAEAGAPLNTSGSTR